MKAITITSNQYTPRSLSWTYLHVCDATDFVFIPPLHPVESDASSKMATAIKTLIDGRGTKTTNVYIGTPGISSTNFSLNPSSNTLTSFLTSVYTNSNITASMYRSKIKGAYMNQETLYGAVNYNNLINGSLPGNIQVKRMNDIKAWVLRSDHHNWKFCRHYK